MLLLIMLSADLGRMPEFIRVLHDFPNGDRVGHVVLFGILAFLFTAAFSRTLRIGRYSLPIVPILLAAFATGEELSQQLFSTRYPDPVDLVCSFLGIALGGWAGTRWRERRKAAAKRPLH
ncbi:MAG: VanZ family protein [Verrucomicrobiota bacterium]